jgi:hypothetical protein
MTRNAAVRERISGLVGLEPHAVPFGEDAVAVGAAIQGGIFDAVVKELLLLDVTPFTLGIETKGGEMTPLIARNTTIPTMKSEVFSTAEDRQSSVEIHVLRGNRPKAAENQSLGKFQLTEIPPAPAGVPQIEVSFSLDSDGTPQVTAKDLGTGKEQRVELKPADADDAPPQATTSPPLAPEPEPEPPPPARNYVAEGQAYEKAGDFAAARDAYDEAIASGELRGAFYLARMYRGRDMFRPAVDAYTQALQAGDGRLVAWAALELGEILERRGRYDTAAEHYRTAAERDDPQAAARARQKLRNLQLSGRVR